MPEVVGLFAREDRFLEACRAARAGGLRVGAFTPWPVHGLEDALGLSRSWIGRPVLGAVALGLLAAYAMQYHLHVLDWPMIYSGKPYHSWPLFAIATLEVGLLLGALANLALCFHTCRLLPDPEPSLPDPRVSDDRLALVAQGDDAAALVAWLAEHGAEETRVLGGAHA